VDLFGKNVFFELVFEHHDGVECHRAADKSFHFNI
jgi:hypothetical protein